MIFFTSDVHFCDEKTFLTDDRPFKNIKAYDKAVIRNFNKVAHKGDTIYVMGDLLDCDGPEYETWKPGIKCVQKLKADVVLIMGNNEDRIVKYFFNNNYESFRQYLLNNGFKDVQKNMKLTLRGVKFNLVHQPIHHQDGYFNLFGHCHRSKGLWQSFGINVSCDLNHYRLWSEDRLFVEMERRNQFIGDENFSVN